MIFAVRQLQETCLEQRQDLYLLFIDITKAFDTVSTILVATKATQESGSYTKATYIITCFEGFVSANVSAWCDPYTTA